MSETSFVELDANSLSEQDKVIALFQYIKELNSMRQSIIKNVGDYPWHLMLDAIPNDQKNIIINYKDRVENENADMTDIIVSVHKPEFQECPVPDALFKDWLNNRWDDYHVKDVSVKEIDGSILGETEKIAADFDKKDETDSLDNISIDGSTRFDDNSERVALFEKWIIVRDEWRNTQLIYEKTQNCFVELYKLYFDLKREAESLELIVANGMLLDRDNRGIKHPVITHRVNIEFDAEKNTIYILDTAQQSELYSILFQNMADVNLDSINMLMNDLAVNDYHPLDRNDLPGYLKTFVHQLSSDSLYVDKNAVDGLQNSRLVMSFAPCFILRKRLDGSIKAIDKIIENISNSGDIPAPLGDLVDGGTIEIAEPKDEETVEERLASVGGESTEILLSKEANKEQLEIAKRIENYNAVLVQGPPGTGKTHTIANLLGHFLAQGKSVLVTSYTTKALSVLKDKVAPGLQSLCVSVLDDSNADMEKSIDGITSYMSHYTSFELKKEMDNLSAQRNEIINKLADVRRKIYTIINQENGYLSYNGESVSPSDIAKFVFEREEDLSYIPGNVSKVEILPLSFSQLSDLYKSNELITSDIESELICELPNPQNLLSPEQFSECCRTIDSAERDIKDIEQRKSWKINNNELQKTIDINGHFAMPYSSLEKVSALIDYCHSLEPFKEWMKYAAIDGKNGGAFKNRWIELISQIEKVCLLYENVVEDQFKNKVEVVSQADLVSSKQFYKEICNFFDTKGKIPKLTRALHKDYERALGFVLINGHEIHSSDECNIVLRLIEYLEEKDRCATYWNDLLATHDAPVFNELDNISPEKVAKNWINTINRYLGWYSNEYRLLENLVSSLGIPFGKLFDISELDSDFTATEKILYALDETVPYLCLVIKNILSVWSTKDYLNSFISICRQEKRSNSDVCKELVRAIASLDERRYENSYVELVSLYEKYDLLMKREEYLSKIASLAPEWALQLRNRVGIHGNNVVPNTIFDAWKWKQFSIIVDEILAQPFSELQRRSLELSKEYRKITAAYAEKCGWYHLLKKTEADIDLKQALQGWKMTVKKIGKGTGKTAPAMKAEARKLMAKCQNAVPAWIMPINKALDNLDPRFNKFDIVIIDEASQSDISSLAILYMGRKLIIVGDDKQVSPMAVGMEVDKISTLEKMYIKGKIPNSHLYTAKTSLYDIAATTFQPLMLREHFRCVPEIIGFSNMLSYDYKIKPLRDASNSKILPAVVNYRVDGGEQLYNKTNPKEAKTIVALMKACMEQEEYAGKSFGVISLLGDEQVKLVQQYIDQQIDPKEIIERNILCGNSANFQGDERDVIFLSVVASNDGDGPLKMQGFGVEDAYKKRYNVAVSRARDQLWVVDSLDSASDLKPGDIRKILIDYSLNPQADEIKKKEIEQNADSPFEASVMKILALKGYHLVQQWKVGAYSIDIVAVCGKKKVAIECDGERWHSGETKIREDMERQTILERLGWRFIRIRGSEFYKNQEKTIERVVAELGEYEIEPEAIETFAEVRSSDLLDRVKIRAAEILNGVGKKDINKDSVIQFALNPEAIERIALKEESIEHTDTITTPVIAGRQSSNAATNYKEQDKDYAEICGETPATVVNQETDEDDREEIKVGSVNKVANAYDIKNAAELLRKTITTATNIDEFKEMFAREGYELIWTDRRKNILFINPGGKHIRGSRISEIYGVVADKEGLERLFRSNLLKIGKKATANIPTAVKEVNGGNDIIGLLERSNVKYVDKRENGGALWIIGGLELKPIVVDAKKLGVFFHYKEDGGKATNGVTGWWAK